MSVEIIKSKIRDVVDFPQKGIVFRDLTTVFKDANCLRELSDMLTAIYAEKHPAERGANMRWVSMGGNGGT